MVIGYSDPSMLIIINNPSVCLLGETDGQTDRHDEPVMRSHSVLHAMNAWKVKIY